MILLLWRTLYIIFNFCNVFAKTYYHSICATFPLRTFVHARVHKAKCTLFFGRSLCRPRGQAGHQVGPIAWSQERPNHWHSRPWWVKNHCLLLLVLTLGQIICQKKDAHCDACPSLFHFLDAGAQKPNWRALKNAWQCAKNYVFLTSTEQLRLV